MNYKIGDLVSYKPPGSTIIAGDFRLHVGVLLSIEDASMFASPGRPGHRLCAVLPVGENRPIKLMSYNLFKVEEHSNVA